MRAAVYRGPGMLTVEDVPCPKVGPGEVLIKVKACSICGTDRKILASGHSKISDGAEAVLGHEIAGEIVETGEGVPYYRGGMRVIIAPNVGCGSCRPCREGLDQLCPTYNAFGLTLPGGFAEYLLVPAAPVARGNLIVIPSDVSYWEAAVVEPLSCCLNGYEALGIRPGDSLLIFGAGPMGNLHLMLNKHLGTGLTFVVDVNQERLELSRNLGADFVLAGDGALKDKVLEFTHGEGVDSIFVAAPVPHLVEQALDLVAINGKVNVFAGLPADNAVLPVNMNMLHYRQVRLVGTTGATRSQLRNVLRLIGKSGLDVKRIITLRITLDQLPSVLADNPLLDRNMKVVVEPTP